VVDSKGTENVISTMEDDEIDVSSPTEDKEKSSNKKQNDSEEFDWDDSAFSEEKDMKNLSIDEQRKKNFKELFPSDSEGLKPRNLFYLYQLLFRRR